MFFKKKVAPHELAVFIVMTSSENIDQIERSVSGDVNLHPQHSPLQAKLLDEAQWLPHVAGLVAVHRLSHFSFAQATLDALLGSLAGIHDTNSHATPFTPQFLAHLKKKLLMYLGAYLQAASWNPSETASKREELALAYVAVIFEEVMDVRDVNLLAFGLLTHFCDFFEKRFRRFRLVGEAGKLQASEAIERASRIQCACQSSFEQARQRVAPLLADGASYGVVFWLADFPQTLFDTVFAIDCTGQGYVPVLLHAETEDGTTCAVVTQAFSLWILQQLLANDSTFQSRMGFDMAEMEGIVAAVLPHAVRETLESYRQRFDIKTLKVDPRDWDIVWLWDITDAVIHSKDTLKKAMGRWNDDVIARIAYVSKMTHLTVTLKQWIMEKLDNDA
jgi:hypothetical protein